MKARGAAFWGVVAWLMSMALCLAFWAFVIWYVLPIPARGDNLGAAYYGIQHPSWPCGRSLRVLKARKIPKVSILWNSFGNRNRCLNKILDAPGKKWLEIHVINEVCIRNGDCAEYEFGAGYSPREYEAAIISRDARFIERLRAYLQKPAAFVRNRPGLTCLISPGLESNLSPGAAEIILNLVRPFFPRCKMVWNPLNALWSKADFIEYHTRRGVRSPCILSNDDGHLPPAYMDDWIAAGANCAANFIWHPIFNGWCGAERCTHPRGRWCWPGPEHFYWLRAQFEI